MKKLTGILLFFCMFSFLFGDDQPDFPDIYIEAGVGGTHVGSVANPYDDLSDINWTTGGDNSIFDWYAGAEDASVIINLNRGDMWREEMTIGASGSATYPIIIQAYGSGDKPIINGADQLSSWTNEVGDLWYCSYASDPYHLWFVETDDSITRGNDEGAKVGVDAEYDWWFDDPNDRIYCHAGTDPDTRYNSVEANVRDYCIVGESKDYITVSNLEMKFSWNAGVRDFKGDGWLIDSNEIHHLAFFMPRGKGVNLSNSSNCTVSNNLIYETIRACVLLLAGGGFTCQDNVVEYNEMFNGHHNTVELRIDTGGGTNTGTIIRFNLIYCTTDLSPVDMCHGIVGENGINSDPINNVEAYYNVIHDLSGYGIFCQNKTQNWNIYNNVICRKLSTFTAESVYGIVVGSNTLGGHDIKNNIALDFDGPSLNVADSSQVASCNYNSWYNSVGAEYTKVDGTFYDSTEFGDYQGDTGWDTNGLWEDPKFVNKAGNDFYLASDSPCRNVGVDLSLALDYDGVSVPQETNPAIGAYEYLVGAILRIREVLRIKNVLRIK